MKRVAAEGTVAHMDEVPEDVRRVFVTAHDITPESHVRIQAAFQRFVDNAVSKTVNFESTATKEDVDEVYKLAYKEGLKGVTIYRDGSRDGQVLNIGKVSGKEEENVPEFGKIEPRPRSTVTQYFTEKVKIGCGNLYITTNYDENGICEVFTSTGKAGGCPSQSEATARLASVALRSGISIEEVYDQLKGIRCPSTIRQQGMSCTSCPDAIAKALMKVSKFIDTEKGNGKLIDVPEEFAPLKKDAENAPTTIYVPSSVNAIHHCPDCNGAVEHEGGCVVCRNCGFSKCG